ncbi:eukaryotic translation initiation factor 4E type 1B isoform 4-T7 [Hipposideros larvatus]
MGPSLLQVHGFHLQGHLMVQDGCCSSSHHVYTESRRRTVRLRVESKSGRKRKKKRWQLQQQQQQQQQGPQWKRRLPTLPGTSCPPGGRPRMRALWRSSWSCTGCRAGGLCGSSRMTAAGPGRTTYIWSPSLTLWKTSGRCTITPSCPVSSPPAVTIPCSRKAMDLPFVSQDGIEPMWEDPRNKRGGRWLVSLSKQQRHMELDHLWLETLLCVIGESFGEYSREVCGAVINIRTKGDKIAVWTQEAENRTGVIHIGHVYKECLGLPPKMIIGYQAHADTATKSSTLLKNNTLLKNKFVM